MRKYYVFNIKESYFESYKDNPEILYKMIEKLYRLKKGELNYGISIFREICYLFNTGVISHYIKEKYDVTSSNLKLLIPKQKTVLEINPSSIIIKTYSNIPPVLSDLNFYSRKLLVCDFDNEDYFWLNIYVKPKAIVL